MENKLSEHLEDIQHGSDFARAMQLVCYGAGALMAVVAGTDLVFDWVEKRHWLSIAQGGIHFVIAGFVLGYVRKVTLTIVQVVEELRTTV